MTHYEVQLKSSNATSALRIAGFDDTCTNNTCHLEITPHFKSQTYYIVLKETTETESKCHIQAVPGSLCE